MNLQSWVNSTCVCSESLHWFIQLGSFLVSVSYILGGIFRIFIWEADKQEKRRGTERESVQAHCHQWGHSQMRAMAGLKPGVGKACGKAAHMGGRTQSLGPCLLPFRDYISKKLELGARAGCQTQGIWYRWDAGTLTTRLNTHFLFVHSRSISVAILEIKFSSFSRVCCGYYFICFFLLV